MGRVGTASCAVCLLMTVAITACSPLNEPEILQSSATVVQELDVRTGNQSSHLELHVHLASDEGEHDTLSVQLIGPRESYLSWEIDADQLLESYTDGELWVGSNSLKAPYAQRFPSGTYTVKVTNADGASDEMDISVSDPLRRSQLPEGLFAHYDRQSGLITASTQELILRGYDENGNPLGFSSVSTRQSLTQQLDTIEAQLGAPLVNFELEVLDPLLGQLFRSGIYSY